MTAPCIFLSHAGADTEAARELKRRMLASPAAREDALTVWFDKDDLVPGASWQSQIARAITEKATAFVVYTGSRGIVNWVENEVELAIERATASAEFPLIPVVSGDARIESLPPFARRYHCVLDPLGNPDEFAKLMRAVLGQAQAAAPELTGQPFVGLRAMTERDSAVFFGREDETVEVLGGLRRHSLVAIVAESGSGKSSLAMAGVAPAFRGGALSDPSRSEPDDRIWHVVVMRPSTDPVEGLREAVTDAAERLGLDPTARASLRSRIDLRNPSETGYAIRCDLPTDLTHTLLVVDQFEELLTQTAEPLRAPFIDLLLWLTQSATGGRVHVLLTLRSDYFNLVAPYAALADLLAADAADRVYRLRRITDHGLKRAIHEPLKLAGHASKAEREALTQLFRRDLMDRPGDLALVQMALYAIWQSRHSHRGDLLEAYAALGGVSGALATQAEGVRNARLDDAERELLLPLMSRLVRMGDAGGVTRRLANLHEFDDARSALARKLATDKCSRLLVVTETTVEVAHEALITQWPWLQNALNERKTAEDVRTLEQLMNHAERYGAAAAAMRAKHIATGAVLESFQRLAIERPNWLSGLERDFVQASGKAARTVRTVRTALVVLLMLISAAMTLLAVELRRAESAAVASKIEAQHAATEAEKAREDAAQTARSLKQLLAKPVGVPQIDLDTRRDQTRGRESAFGRLAADAIRSVTAAEFAVISSGSIRSNKLHPRGQVITFEDMLVAFPFNNKVVRFEVTGEAIRNGFEAIFADIDRPKGGFPQVSGAQVVVHRARPPGQRVEIVSIGGRPFSPSRRYKVATLEFHARGGDGYKPLTEGQSDYREFASEILVIGAALTSPNVDPSGPARVVVR